MRCSSINTLLCPAPSKQGRASASKQTRCSHSLERIWWKGRFRGAAEKLVWSRWSGKDFWRHWFLNRDLKDESSGLSLVMLEKKHCRQREEQREDSQRMECIGETTRMPSIHCGESVSPQGLKLRRVGLRRRHAGLYRVHRTDGALLGNNGYGTMLPKSRVQTTHDQPARPRAEHVEKEHWTGGRRPGFWSLTGHTLAGTEVRCLDFCRLPFPPM